MATVLQNLQARREAVAQQIADLSASNYDLPNASAPHPVDFTGKIKSLYDELDMLERAIARAEGSWEIATEVDT